MRYFDFSVLGLILTQSSQRVRKGHRDFYSCSLGITNELEEYFISILVIKTIMISQIIDQSFNS